LIGAPEHIAASARNWVRKRDFYAGIVIILLGLVPAVTGPSYDLGTLMRMGPGFMPTALGVILIVLGIIIAGSALTLPEGEDEDILPEQPQWRGWACVLAGPILFMVFGYIGGLVPATFGCVFISALGDRSATLKGSFVLGSVISVFAVIVFHYFLQIPMPVLTWRGLWS
jgi:hypothetical protein